MGSGVRVLGPKVTGIEEILTADALAFLADLHRRFDARRRGLLAARVEAKAGFDRGELPHFPTETAEVRAAEWTVAPLPADLQDRRVEITGPVDRKMIINALNSGAKMFMADFEDSTSPTWANLLDGQLNLRDAVNRTIAYEHETKGRYTLGERTATLLVRPRGLHLPEAHVEVDGEPMSGSLFDFGLFFFHNAREQVARGTGPYFYLPKLEHYLEARWWNDVFVAAQLAVGVPVGTIRATVLIETLPASFQLDEILYELRDHSSGLNCGRWDYIFSYIKTLRAHPDRVLPNRSVVTMVQPCMRAYTQRVIQVCHRRKAPAMGGMAAQIPIKGDDAANEAAMAKVRADKLREVTDGHDGTWVAHPGLVGLATAIFDEHMPTPNQISRDRSDFRATEAELLEVPTGARTEAGVQECIRVGVQYLEAWLGGSGCVPLYNLMEDAATAEISRSQLWQWVKHSAKLDDGRVVDLELVRAVIAREMAELRERLGAKRFDGGHFERAVALFDAMIAAPELPDFLTLSAYPYITTLESR